MASGSTYPEVSRGKFREFEVIVPARPLTLLFDEYAAHLLGQIRILNCRKRDFARHEIFFFRGL